MKRCVLSLLLALFLAGGMISCSETTNTDPSAAPENAAAVPSAEETVPAEPEDTNAHLYEDLPTGDFEGRSFSILTPYSFAAVHTENCFFIKTIFTVHMTFKFVIVFSFKNSSATRAG